MPWTGEDFLLGGCQRSPEPNKNVKYNKLPLVISLPDWTYSNWTSAAVCLCTALLCAQHASSTLSSILSAAFSLSQGVGRDFIIQCRTRHHVGRWWRYNRIATHLSYRLEIYTFKLNYFLNSRDLKQTAA